MNIVELKAEMMKLPKETRAELAKALVECLEISNDELIQPAWIDEAVRLRHEVRSGKAETFPSGRVIAEVREMLFR